jgi:hypothetical protein
VKLADVGQYQQCTVLTGHPNSFALFTCIVACPRCSLGNTLFSHRAIAFATMAAYFTRSIVRPQGFYRALNNRSSLDADSIDKPTTSSFTSLSEQDIHKDEVYKVERLVQRRNRYTNILCPRHSSSFCVIGSYCGRGTGRRMLPGSRNTL